MTWMRGFGMGCALLAIACSGSGDIPDGGVLECGTSVCNAFEEYCERRTSSTSGDSFECRPLPSECDGEISCACVTDEECGSSCSSNNDQITLSCSE